MQVLPVPKEEATPWYKNKMYIIIIVVVLLLLVGGIIGLILAMGSGGSSDLCKKSSANHCICNGVEYPVIIDGSSIVFHNKTFCGAEQDRIKSVNCNNTVTTYSIFEAIDADTRQCKTTFGTIEYNFSGANFKWDGQLKDGVAYGQGTQIMNDGNPIYTIMREYQQTGFGMVTNPGASTFYLGEMSQNGFNGFLTYYNYDPISITNACDTRSVDNFRETVAS